MMTLNAGAHVEMNLENGGFARGHTYGLTHIIGSAEGVAPVGDVSLRRFKGRGLLTTISAEQIVRFRVL